jgi:hypothetical protein
MRRRKDKSAHVRDRTWGRTCKLAVGYLVLLYILWIAAHYALGYRRKAWFYQGVGFIFLFLALVFSLLLLILTCIQIAVLWIFVRCRRYLSRGYRRWGPKAKDESELASELSGAGPSWRGVPPGDVESI